MPRCTRRCSVWRWCCWPPWCSPCWPECSSPGAWSARSSALRAGAERIGSGDFNQRISIKTGDELEGLANQFNDMGARLQESYADLENKVEQRTAELGESLQDLRTAQDRLVQTEKLASLGQLTAGIAHEIKNPLNFVNNFSALSVGIDRRAERRAEAGRARRQDTRRRSTNSRTC